VLLCAGVPEEGWAFLDSPKDCKNWKIQAATSDSIVVAQLEKFVNPVPEQSTGIGAFKVAYDFKGSFTLGNIIEIEIPKEQYVYVNGARPGQTSDTVYSNPGDYNLLFLTKQSQGWQLSPLCSGQWLISSPNLDDISVQKILNILLEGKHNDHQQ
jgi:hypothetical protein